MKYNYKDGFQNQLGFLAEMAILLGQKYGYDVLHLNKLYSMLESIKGLEVDEPEIKFENNEPKLEM